MCSGTGRYVLFVGFEIGASGNVRGDFQAALCIGDKEVRGALMPSMAAMVSVEAFILVLPIAKAGIRIIATVMETQFVPTVLLGLLPGGATALLVR